MFRLEEIAGELREVVAALDPAVYDGRDAARLTKVAADGEKLFATAKILLARRAAETRGWVGRSSAASSEIEERDQRCKVRGCDATQHLQRHHVEEYAQHHITSYDVLGWICADDHHL
jgi:hypothetical protein